MEGSFNFDNPILNALSKMFDCVFLSFLWLVFSIPLITFGASTTALYYTVNKVIRHGRSHVWREFWGSFKSNFKQSTIVWMLFFVFLAIVGVDFLVFRKNAKITFQPLSTLFLTFFNILMVWCVYIFAYIARFSCSTKLVFKNTFLILAMNLHWTILVWLITGVTVFLMVTFITAIPFPLLWVVIPTPAMLLINLVLERVYKKYMSPEDLEKEKELNEKDM